MTTTKAGLDTPALLAIHADGMVTGATRRYEKHAGDMSGVYLDQAAWKATVADSGTDALVYFVNEHKYGSGAGDLIIGTSTLLPGSYGDEYAVTRGHLHAKSDRAELYYCLSGRGVMLMETVDGDTSAIELTPGLAVNVPGEWVHRSVNVGTEPFVTLFCYGADAGQNYDIISDAGGMSVLVVRTSEGGWTTRPNPRHVGYPHNAA